MKNQQGGEHASPEVFIDLLDGTPVDAQWRQHFERCPQCRNELAELRGTTALLDTTRQEDAIPSKHGQVVIPSVSRTGIWLGAAAAVILALVMGGRWLATAPPAEPIHRGAEALLPPVEQDMSYQILLAWSDGMRQEELVELAAEDEFTLSVDTDELTPEQRREILAALAAELEQEVS